KQRESECEPEPRKDAWLFEVHRPCPDPRLPTRRGYRLVENCTVGKVLLLRFRPAAEIPVDGDELQFRQARQILRRRELRFGGPVIVLGNNSLSCRCVKKVEIGLRSVKLFPAYDVAIDPGDRWFGENGD